MVTRVDNHVHSPVSRVRYVLVHKARKETRARVVVLEVIGTCPRERHKGEWNSSDTQCCEGEAHGQAAQVRCVRMKRGRRSNRRCKARKKSKRRLRTKKTKVPVIMGVEGEREERR
jgi:hypothetical protein